MGMSFFHHLLFACLDEVGRGRKPTAAELKAAVAEATHVNGSLKGACRHEVALLPPADLLFDSSALPGKLKRLVFAAIKEASNLRWILPVADFQAVRAGLPEDWIGKGYPNVCLAAILSDGVETADTLNKLREIPSRWKMAIILAAGDLDLKASFKGVDWVVIADGREDDTVATAARQVCLDGGITCLDLSSPTTSVEEPPAADANVPLHPFGNGVDLTRPTLPGLVPAPVDSIVSLFATTPRLNLEGTFGTPPADPVESESPASEPPVAAGEPGAGLDSFDLVLPSEEMEEEAVARRDFERLDGIARRGVAAFKECGMALAEIHDRQLWKAGGYSNWEAYSREVLGLSKPHAHRLMKAAGIAAELEALPNGNGASRMMIASESQARELGRLKDPGDRAKAWFNAVGRASGQPTAKVVSEAVAEILAEFDHQPPPAPSRKQKLVDLFQRLRVAAVAAKRNKSEVEKLLDELGSLLDL